MLKQEINLCVLLLSLYPGKNKVKTPNTSFCSITHSILSVFYGILNPHCYGILLSGCSVPFSPAPSHPNEYVKVRLGCSVRFSCKIIQSAICDQKPSSQALETLLSVIRILVMLIKLQRLEILALHFSEILTSPDV